MMRSETLEDFYSELYITIPSNLKFETGHFNVFKFNGPTGCLISPIPYNRREYFKISLIIGRNKVHYADQTIVIEKQALLFANPHVPYSWEQISEDQKGYSCVFTGTFFHHFGNPKDYSVFKPNAVPVVELSDEQLERAEQLFAEMYADWESQYAYKFDRMRILVFELLHIGVKAQPVKEIEISNSNASKKITKEFLELLERQFTDEYKEGIMQLRSASDFAEHLSIHVNHLNKALRETIGKRTSAVVHERIILEAKILLKHGSKDVSEIAFFLGFKENTHFNNFFKKHTGLSPKQFRAI
ncbi:helix-turn-helix transcriptional regulator [Flavobacterium sp. CFBP9031]|uniref:helix-turn-helix domain-containing protein n=1 Tax=Flavobacterium sp. CFBP9031 TaxID=3096538 RepID=UPI002A6B5714|nr:helix-turn-helix transcriptional regulator [Flavobacterium sp. CFBP9031]MDY0986678.1 helix-turn-helix transcriptional regulator [Flavobacterium sp. CFBP9031]